jgi:hypothetical protein
MRSHSPKRRAPALLGNGPSPATCLHQHRTVGAGPKPEFDFVGIDPTSIVRSSPSSVVAALLEAFLPRAATRSGAATGVCRIYQGIGRSTLKSAHQAATSGAHFAVTLAPQQGRLASIMVAVTPRLLLDRNIKRTFNRYTGWLRLTPLFSHTPA